MPSDITTPESRNASKNRTSAVEELLRRKNPALQEAAKRLQLDSFHERDGILEQVGTSDYAANFGAQWTNFSTTQVDSATGRSFSRDRLLETTGWEPAKLRGKLILEIGSGAGRFTEIFLEFGSLVVSIDLSEAAFVNERNNSHRNLLILRTDFRALSDLAGMFDYVIALGVAQHTPNPREVYEHSVNLCSKGGKVCIDQYQTRILPHPLYHPKYLWRPLTTRLPHRSLLKIVEWYVPRYLVLDNWILNIFGKKWGNPLRGISPIPCWNYRGIEGFPQDNKSLETWAVLDTFDALSAKYDYPISRRTLRRWLSRIEASDFQIVVGGNGLISRIVR